jgi:Zn-dependent protease with chaperone function
MSLAVTAAALAAFSCVLLGPASTWLSRSEWLYRTPRCGVLLWQCVGVAAAVSGICAGLAVAVTRYHSGFAAGTRELFEEIFSGRPLQGLGLYDALGLTLAADLGIVLVVLFTMVTTGTIRQRARHRRILDLVTYGSPEYPGTELLSEKRAVAYCLPGLRPRIVLSQGTLDLLDTHELWAVIHHERGHAHEHHGLVMLPMSGVQNLFAWIPYARFAPLNISRLLEMAADDFSVRRSDKRHLVQALVQMADNGWAPSCGLAATGSDVFARVSRLVGPNPTSRSRAVLAASLAIGAVLVPVSIALLG